MNKVYLHTIFEKRHLKEMGYNKSHFITTNIDIKKGTKFSESHPLYKGYLTEYHIISTQKNEGRGQIEMDVIKTIQPRSKDRYYQPNERRIIVDIIWFDIPLTKRVLKTI